MSEEVNLATVFLHATRGILPNTLLRLKKPTRAVLRSGLAIAAAAGSYKIFRELFQLYLSEYPAIDDRASSICGAASTAVGVLVDNSWASSLFSLWYFLKGLRMSGLLPHVKYGPVVILMIATTIVTPAAYVNPEEHHPSYWNFLQQWVTGVGITIDQWRFPPPGGTLSDGIHPGQSILEFMFTRVIPINFYQALRINFPLYVLQALRGYSRFEGINKWSRNLLRSTLFLSTYINALWLGLLTHSKLIGGAIPRAQCYTWVGFSALALLIERPSRRIELATFVSAHALNSIYRHFMLRGFYRPRVWVGALLLCTSSYWVFDGLGKPKNGKIGLFPKWVLGERDRRSSSSDEEEEVDPFEC